MLKTELNVAQEIKNPGREAKAELEFFPENLDICGRKLVPDGKLCVRIFYSYDGEGSINAKGTVTGRFIENCARCGKKTPYVFECDFAERFIKQNAGNTENDADRDSFFFTGDCIDLTDFLTELLLLNYPMTVVCDENCKGLCPVCGKNLNDGSCSCGGESEIIDGSDANAFEKALARLKSKYTVN